MHIMSKLLFCMTLLGCNNCFSMQESLIEGVKQFVPRIPIRRFYSFLNLTVCSIDIVFFGAGVTLAEIDFKSDYSEKIFGKYCIESLREVRVVFPEGIHFFCIQVHDTHDALHMINTHPMVYDVNLKEKGCVYKISWQIDRVFFAGDALMQEGVFLVEAR